jgi:dTDP-4-amino-4,6-dideoxygalactose transaminase
MQDTKKKTSSNKPIGERGSLPMHTELDDEQIKFITDSVLEFLNKKVLN